MGENLKEEDFDEEIVVNEDGDDMEELDQERDISKGKKLGRCDPTKLESDVAEVKERFKVGCECLEEKCFRGLNPESVYRHRLNIAELTKSEHHLYLMGLMMACITDPHHTEKKTDRQKLRTHYVYQGRRVCLESFLYLENTTRYQLKKIKKHLIVHGVTPRVHGNARKIPHNTLSLDCYQVATRFFQDFIKERELVTKAGKHSPSQLPAEISRKNIHHAYKEYCKNVSTNIPAMGYSTFCKFIKKQFPHVKFVKLDAVRPQQVNVSGGELREPVQKKPLRQKKKAEPVVMNPHQSQIPINVGLARSDSNIVNSHQSRIPIIVGLVRSEGNVVNPHQSHINQNENMKNREEITIEESCLKMELSNE